MRLKVCTLMFALLLVVTTSMAPTKAAGQGLVEYALILVLLPAGIGEAAEIVWRRGNPEDSQALSQDFVLIVTNAGDSSCPSEVVTTSVDAVPGLNTLTVEKNGEMLAINGQPSFLSEPCNFGATRFVYQLGVPFPHGLNSESASDTDSVIHPIRMENCYIVSYSVYATTDGSSRTITAMGNHPSTEDGAIPAQNDELVVGVGTTQNLNLYLDLRKRGVPSTADSEPGIAGVSITLLTNDGIINEENVCTQTIQASVDFAPGLQTLTLGIGSDAAGKTLLVNGVVEEILDGCFDGAERVVYIVGDLNSFAFGDPAAAEPVGWTEGFWIFDVTDATTGATVATGAMNDSDGRRGLANLHRVDLY